MPGGAAPQRPARSKELRKLATETTERPPDADGAAPRRPGSRVGSSVRYGQVAMQAAMNLFALTAVAAASLHVPITFGFAFASAIAGSLSPLPGCSASAVSWVRRGCRVRRGSCHVRRGHCHARRGCPAEASPV